MHQGIEFFTATCLNWQPLLLPDERKDILMDSLKFMVNDKRIWLYGFVIMPNHIHLMWLGMMTNQYSQIRLSFTMNSGCPAVYPCARLAARAAAS